MRIQILLLTASALLASCDVKDPIYNTAYPDYGKITLTTDWTGRGAGVDIPASYTVSAGTYTETFSAATNPLNHLFEPGAHTLFIYNEPANIKVNGLVATADYAAGAAGWLFSCALPVTVETDKVNAFTAPMRQQVRRLTLVLAPEGDAVELIHSITATLSGVAGTFDIGSSAHGTPAEAPMTFSKITTGEDAGKWAATTCLLGIVEGARPTLKGTVTYTGNTPAPTSFTSDMTAGLAGFNTGKTEPFTLGAGLETPTKLRPTTTVTDWEVVERQITVD